MINLQGKRILVTGGHGFLGRFVAARLSEKGAVVVAPRSSDYDLRKESDVALLFEREAPQAVVHLAAKVGGIGANRLHPGSFYFENLLMGTWVIEYARRHDVEKILSVSSVCAYPKHVPIPTSEDHLWDGYPEETNAGYGLAKKMLIVQSQMYKEEYGLNAVALLMVNMYGPGDNFDPESSHVVPALIRKCLEARNSGAPAITVWGSGKATRDFLYVEDAAEGVVRALERYDSAQPLNIGSGKETSIAELVRSIAATCEYKGDIVWDATKPDGQPRRLFEIARARSEIGYEPRVELAEGLARTISWYESQCLYEKVQSN